ncbi:MAG: FAD-binding monooxygenase [Betaproteobacteria bacterium]|nr:FAD-binding monooxygenase [Betaproteobacteria bacterium]
MDARRPNRRHAVPVAAAGSRNGIAALHACRWCRRIRRSRAHCHHPQRLNCSGGARHDTPSHWFAHRNARSRTDTTSCRRRSSGDSTVKGTPLNLEKLRILIVGAGVAGLALGRALRRCGCFPDIIERKTDWGDVGTGMYLPGNALRALRSLELDIDVAKQGAQIETQRFCDHRGKLLSEINLGSVWNETGPCIAAHRADLHHTLRNGKDAPPIRMGVTLVSLDQAANSTEAHLSDGARETYDLVVGADGIGSSVRRLVFGDAVLRPLRQWGWRFVIPCPPQVTTWSVLMSRKSACLTMPIGGGRAYCYVDLMGTESPATSEDRLQEVLADFAGPAVAVRDALEGSVEIHAAAIEEVVLDSWSHGRALLIGDAAHAMSPNMAQGAAMAVEDAIVLAEFLSEQPSIETALSAYEARRRPRVGWVQAMTHRRDRIRQLHPMLRNGLLRSFGHRVYRSNYRLLLAEP